MYVSTMEHQSNSGEKTYSFKAHEQAISSCRFLDQDRFVATASHDKTIAIWGAGSGCKLHSLCGHDHRVVSISVNKSSSTLLSASWDKSIVLWDLNSVDKVWRGCHESLVTSCHTASELHLAVAGCDDGSYHYWDTRTAQSVASVNAHTNTITCCRFSPNNMDLCTCSMDKTSLIWDIRSHKQLLKLSGHVNVVSGCAFSPNSHYLATCSWDKTVCVYDVTSGSYRAKGPVELSDHMGCASACSFSKDGTLLVSCGYDQDINIWNTNNFQLKNTFRGHEGWIEDVDIGESSKQIISCGKDGVIHVWHIDMSYDHYKKKGNPGLNVVTCSKCGRTFSPVGNPWKRSMASAEQNQAHTRNITDKHQQDEAKDEREKQEDCVRLCVFCRMQDPSRSLEQRSGHYLTNTQYIH